MTGREILSQGVWCARRSQPGHGVKSETVGAAEVHVNGSITTWPRGDVGECRTRSLTPVFRRLSGVTKLRGDYE
jgi:hypothetical protein